MGKTYVFNKKGKQTEKRENNDEILNVSVKTACYEIDLNEEEEVAEEVVDE